MIYWPVQCSHQTCIAESASQNTIYSSSCVHGWPSTQPGTCTQPCPIVHSAVHPLFTQLCPGRTMSTAVCIYGAGLCANSPAVYRVTCGVVNSVVTDDLGNRSGHLRLTINMVTHESLFGNGIIDESSLNMNFNHTDMDNIHNHPTYVLSWNDEGNKDCLQYHLRIF